MIRSKALYLTLLAGFTVIAASATTINFTGEDPARSFSIWMRATYNIGDQLTSGQSATVQQTINEQVPAGVMNLVVDTSTMSTHFAWITSF